MQLRLTLQHLILVAAFHASAAGAVEPISGSALLSEETRAMQEDDFANPGMEAVEHGRELFREPGFNGNSCATCHGEDGEKLKPGRIAQFPIFSKTRGKPITLQEQVNICLETQMDAFPLIYDDADMLGMESFIRYKARGQIVNVQTDGPMQPYYEAGRKLYNTRFGQFDMACVHCHDYYQGKQLRGQVLSQGQSNAFPVFRLSTGRITSLHRRFSECFASFRAIPFEPGSQEYRDLELFLAARGNGLRIETPGVRD